MLLVLYLDLFKLTVPCLLESATWQLLPLLQPHLRQPLSLHLHSVVSQLLHLLHFHWFPSINQNLIGWLQIFMNNSSYSNIAHLLINGPHSHVPANLLASVFLNWFGDCLYELINTIEFFPGKSKNVLNDVIEQSESYFKPIQSTFQLWYELRSCNISQFKNQNDFLNQLFHVSKDCELDNPNELLKFLFLVHNQKSCL